MLKFKLPAILLFCFLSPSYVRAQCSTPCANGGSCIAADTCACTPGWSAASFCLTAVSCSTPCGTNAFCTSTNTCSCIATWTNTSCTPAFAFPHPDNYIPEFSFVKGGGVTHLDSYLPLGAGAIQASTGALRLVNSSTQRGSIWSKGFFTLTNFDVNASVEFGQSGSSGDGFGIFIGWNLQRSTANTLGNEFTVNWDSYSGLAVLFAPRFNRICAMSTAVATAYDRTCGVISGYPLGNVFNFNNLAPGVLRQKIRIGIIVTGAQTITVEGCTTEGCTRYIDQQQFTLPYSLASQSMYLGVGGQSSADASDYVDLHELKVYTRHVCNPACKNGAYCLQNATCKCTTGWAGVDCSLPSCNPPCVSPGGTCTAVNVCTCAAGWYGATCANVSTCDPVCPTNAQCTGANTCTCLSGWSGADCTTPTQWVFPAGSELPQYAMSPGSLSNYDNFIWTLISNPQPGGAYRMINKTGLTASIFSKVPISGLPNFNVNVTVQIVNTGNGGEGFAIDIISGSAMRKPSTFTAYSGYGTNTHIGLSVRVSSSANQFCIVHFASPSVYNTQCSVAGVMYRSMFNGNPDLRQKMHIGLEFNNYNLTSVYMCNVTTCAYVFNGLGNVTIANLQGPLFLGINAHATTTWDPIDLHHIKVYARPNPCGASECIYGSCNQGTNTCTCSVGYTGTNCGAPICNPMCNQAGTCQADGTCLCAPGWQGPTCSDYPACNTPCPTNAQCTSNNTCTCLAGWSGVNCTTRNYVSPSLGSSPINLFTMSAGNMSNYDNYIVNGMPNPQGTTVKWIRMISAFNQQSSIWAKMPIHGLRDYTLNITIQVQNTWVTGDGFSIEWAASSAVRRIAAGTSLSSWVPSNYIGLMIRVAPNRNAICITYNKSPVTPWMRCESQGGVNRFVIANGNPNLRVKMWMGMTVVDNKLIAVHWCSVAGCFDVWSNLTQNYDIAALSQGGLPVYLGFSGFSSAAEMDLTDLYDVKLYPKIDGCPFSCHFGVCNATQSMCVCSDGFTGAACDVPLCSPYCANGGSCVGPNNCSCSAGYYGPSCNLAASCAVACPLNAMCTGNNVCTCLAGWSGANCTTAASPAYVNLESDLIPDYTLTNGDFSKYDLYVWTSITGNPQPGTKALRLVNAVGQVSTIWAKYPISGLNNFNLNITIQIGNSGNTGNGFSIDFASMNSVRRTVNPTTFIQQPYTGMTLRFTPTHNAICIVYSTTGTGVSTNCANSTSVAPKFSTPFLRQKYNLGITIENGIMTRVHMCTVASCQYVFSGLTFDIRGIPAPVYLGITGVSSANEFDIVDLYDVKAYLRPLCSKPCVYGICNATTDTCTCAPGYMGVSCDINACEAFPCKNAGYCTGYMTCWCPAGWTGTDCSRPVCNTPCASGGSCTAPNTCTCASGWTGSLCHLVATCTTPCSWNSHCTTTNTCKCLAGYSGAGCATTSAWIFPSSSQLPQFTLSSNGNTSNYNLHVWNTILNPQPLSNAIRLISGGSQVSAAWTKYPITGLFDFNVNVTIMVRPTGNHSDGFSIEIASSSTIQKPIPRGNLQSWLPNSGYAGLMIRVTPFNNKICIIYNPTISTNVDINCLQGNGPSFNTRGHPNLRTKMHFGLLFENGFLSTVLKCDTWNCEYIFRGLKYDLSQIIGPELHLGVTAYASSANTDIIELNDVKIHTRPVSCNVSCVFGKCQRNAKNICICSRGYMGAACDIPVCNCQNGGQCLAPSTCNCPPQYTGIDCSMIQPLVFKAAQQYELLGGNILDSVPVNRPYDCAELCRNTTGCRSANVYHQPDLTCNLLDKDFASLGVQLVCNENASHWTMNSETMLGYFPNRKLAYDLLASSVCPRPYDTKTVTCINNRWTASCTPKVYTDCWDAWLNNETRSGVYSINPDNGAAPFEVWCKLGLDQTTGSTGGFTVVLRRRDGSTNFNVNYATMRSGFGSVDSEFFVGTDALNRLTAVSPRELTYVMWPFHPDRSLAWARWSSFAMGNAANNYTFSSSGFSSPFIGMDIFRVFNGKPLRTFDADTTGCVNSIKGPSFTNGSPCSVTNPFGQFLYGYQTVSGTGVSVSDYMGSFYSMQSIEWLLK